MPTLINIHLVRTIVRCIKIGLTNSPVLLLSTSVHFGYTPPSLSVICGTTNHLTPGKEAEEQKHPAHQASANTQNILFSQSTWAQHFLPLHPFCNLLTIVN